MSDETSHQGEGPGRVRKAAKAVRGAVVPGGNRAIDYTTRTISRDIARLKGGLPSIKGLRDEATGANVTLPDTDHDYSVAGIKPEYRARWQRNVVVAWWLYAAIGLMGLFSLSIGFALLMGDGSGVFLIIVNTLLCGVLGTVSGALLSLKAARDLRLMTTGERLSLARMLSSADAWLPIYSPGFMRHTLEAFPVIAVVLLFLVGGPLTLFLLVKAKAGLVAIAAAIAFLGLALYGLRRWVVHIDAITDSGAAPNTRSAND